MTPREFVARLKNVRGKEPDWTACCPGHADRRASLHVTANDDRLLVRCFAGDGERRDDSVLAHQQDMGHDQRHHGERQE